MRLMFSVLGIAAVLLAAEATVAADTKSDGVKVFNAQKCSTCHSIEGKGNKKGPLDEVGSKLTAAQIKEWITDPEGMAAKTKPAPTRKPPMKKKVMPAGDVDALVAWLSTLKKS